MQPAQHVAKARRLLAGGHHSLARGFIEAAGREAYLAGLHAALAHTLAQIGRRPKTHRGARSELAKLARDDPRIDNTYATFLGYAYELKSIADYDEVKAITIERARDALRLAADVVDAIAAAVEP